MNIRKKKILRIGVVFSIIGLFIIACIIVAFTISSGPPSMVLRGTVKDATSGQAIKGAKVSDYEYGTKPYQNSVTDEQGKYRYLTWPEEHTIVAEAPGYLTEQKGITTSFLHTEKEIVLDFTLVPTPPSKLE